jgi:hypothetical protein
LEHHDSPIQRTRGIATNIHIQLTSEHGSGDQTITFIDLATLIPPLRSKPQPHHRNGLRNRPRKYHPFTLFHAQLTIPQARRYNLNLLNPLPNSIPPPTKPAPPISSTATAIPHPEKHYRANTTAAADISARSPRRCYGKCKGFLERPD